jgi:lysyl-tRNA synthetase class 2
MPSSVISTFHYEPDKRRLDVVFVRGRRYAYHAVPAPLAAAMKQALSKGEFFNSHIRDRFRFTRED